MSCKLSEIKNIIIDSYDKINFSELPDGEYLKINNLLQKIYAICDKEIQKQDNTENNNNIDENDESNDISSILENNQVYYDMFITQNLCECELNMDELCEPCLYNGSINCIKSCCNYNNLISDEPSILYVLSKFDTNIIPTEPFIFMREPCKIEEKDPKYYEKYLKLVIEFNNYRSKDIDLLLYIFICNFSIKHFNTISDKYYALIPIVYQKINELLYYEDDVNNILSLYGEDIDLIRIWKNIISETMMNHLTISI